MRITGGELRSRLIPAKGLQIRPTQDKVREALFSSIGARVRGCRFLDLYAGTGSVGLEAWSRGAAAVHWVEYDAKLAGALRTRVAGLCTVEDGREAVVDQQDAEVFLKRDEPVFDILFADPPYEVSRTPEWFRKILNGIGGGSMVARGGSLILEVAAKSPVPGDVAPWRLAKEKSYGGSKLLYLQK